MLAIDIISATLGGVAAVGRTALHVTDLVQAPAEVESATSEIHDFQKKLGDLIELRKKHAALLSKSPADEAVIETTIATAWRDLKKAKEALEPNRIERKGPVGLGRRFRWKFSGHADYRTHELAIRRNHTEVRDQIYRLEQMVRLGPLEDLERRTREDALRRKEEMDRARDERDMKGLEYLEPVVVVVREVKSLEEEADNVSRGSSISSSDEGSEESGGRGDYLEMPVGLSSTASPGSMSSGSTLQAPFLPSTGSYSDGLGSSGLITGMMAEFMAPGGGD